MDENNHGTVLPPLPPSDEKSLEYNKYDSFYGYKARDFWGKNKITREKIEDFKTCDHFFKKNGNAVECQKCHFGLLGLFEISNGKLFYKGKGLEI